MLLFLGGIRLEKTIRGVHGRGRLIGLQGKTDLHAPLSPLVQERSSCTISSIAAKSHHLKTISLKTFLPSLDPETFP
jgi:hypothetical protein